MVFYKNKNFWDEFGSLHNSIKNVKILQNVPQMMSATWILAGPAECAGQPGGGGGLKPSILDLEGA